LVSTYHRARWPSEGIRHADRNLDAVVGVARRACRDKWGDPYPLMEQLRQQGRLVRTPFITVTTDHELCRTILRDNRFKVSAPSELGLPRPVQALVDRTDLGLPNPVEPPAMLMVDPPDHTRYRRLVAQSFTPRAIDSLAGRVAEVTTHLLDGLDSIPQPDLLRDFATRLPLAVIAEILGLPDDTHPRLLQWGSSGAPLLDMGISWATFRGAVVGLRDADDFLREHFQQLRAGERSDNPFSRMATGDELTHRELAANAALLVGAGFETTVNLIGNGIVLLLRHPEQLALLRDDPDLWDGAVEEILRFDSPVQMTARTASRDVTILGHDIAAGEMVAMLLGGANRDPAVFTNPGLFDITRPNAREHLAFASGVHACLGAASSTCTDSSTCQPSWAATGRALLPGPHSLSITSPRGSSPHVAFNLDVVRAFNRTRAGRVEGEVGTGGVIVTAAASGIGRVCAEALVDDAAQRVDQGVVTRP
jgi:cytochrome P450